MMNRNWPSSCPLYVGLEKSGLQHGLDVRLNRDLRVWYFKLPQISLLYGAMVYFKKWRERVRDACMYYVLDLKNKTSKNSCNNLLRIFYSKHWDEFNRGWQDIRWIKTNLSMGLCRV